MHMLNELFGKFDQIAKVTFVYLGLVMIKQDYKLCSFIIYEIPAIID